MATQPEDSPLYDYITQKMDEIAQYLESGNKDEVDTTYGKAIRPLGSAKLKLVEAIYYSIKLGVSQINHEISLKKIFKILMVN